MQVKRSLVEFPMYDVFRSLKVVLIIANSVGHEKNVTLSCISSRSLLVAKVLVKVFPEYTGLGDNMVKKIGLY